MLPSVWYALFPQISNKLGIYNQGQCVNFSKEFRTNKYPEYI